MTMVLTFTQRMYSRFVVMLSPFWSCFTSDLSLSRALKVWCWDSEVGEIERHLQAPHALNGHDAGNRLILCSDGETPGV